MASAAISKCDFEVQIRSGGLVGRPKAAEAWGMSMPPFRERCNDPTRQYCGIRIASRPHFCRSPPFAVTARLDPNLAGESETTVSEVRIISCGVQDGLRPELSAAKPIRMRRGWVFLPAKPRERIAVRIGRSRILLALNPRYAWFLDQRALASRQAGAGMAGTAGLPDQFAFHSEPVPASQFDRAAMGSNPPQRHPQQMLRNRRPIRRRHPGLPARKRSAELGHNV